jgi:predicted secreted protein
MTFRQKLGELIVPGIVLVGCLLFWLHVQDARSVARRVPSGVILFTLALTLLTLAREFVFPPKDDQNASAEPPAGRDVLVKRVAFVLLCIGYYAVFQWLGFNLANLVFLLLAYMLAGMTLFGAVLAAVVSSVVFYLLATVMEFNVPVGPFGF